MSFSYKDITEDHLYGFQDECKLEVISKKRELFFNDEDLRNPMYKKIEELADLFKTFSEKIIKVTSPSNENIKITFIFKNGLLNSPSSRIPAVVVETEWFKHSLWYKYGIPYRYQLPNYIIEYEDIYHTHVMFTFDEKYKKNDTYVKGKLMPAKMISERTKRGPVFECFNYVDDKIQKDAGEDAGDERDEKTLAEKMKTYVMNPDEWETDSNPDD